MHTLHSILISLKPGISKRCLLFVAGAVWTFAGGMLYYKGFTTMAFYPKTMLIKICGCISTGTIFYGLIFTKIQLKHTQRILALPNAKPCFFSFFNWQSYFMMALMISFGILLRKTDIVSPEYLSAFYITMGTPLILSALAFTYYGIHFKKTIIKLC